jgi:hypothetical protein
MSINYNNIELSEFTKNGNQINEIDKLGFIENLDDELLLENIYEQIDKLLIDSYEVINYIEIFESRYRFLKLKIKDDDEFIEKLNIIRDSFFDKILARINNKFSLSLEFNDGSKYICIKNLYEFFVLEYKKNLITFIIEYIKNNKIVIAI